MTGLREIKKRALRDRLYDAAISLFEARSYEAVSVAEIVEAAGVAKGTFFNHFPTKAHVLAEWYAQLIEGSLGAVDETGSVADTLCRLAESAIERAERHPELWRAKHVEAMASPALHAVEARSDTAVRDHVRALLERAIGKGEFRPGLDIEQFSALYTALVTGTTREWAVSGREGALSDLLRTRITALCDLAR